MLNGFKRLPLSPITRSQMHLNALETRAREGEKERVREREAKLIEQFQCPALLIRFISQPPEVNHHTHSPDAVVPVTS